MALPILFDDGFRPPALRIERLEGDSRDCRNGVEDVTLSGRGEECQVDRILVGLLGRERSQQVRIC